MARRNYTGFAWTDFRKCNCSSICIFLLCYLPYLVLPFSMSAEPTDMQCGLCSHLKWPCKRQPSFNYLYTDFLFCEDGLALFYFCLPWFGFSLAKEVVAPCLGHNWHSTARALYCAHTLGHSVLNIFWRGTGVRLSLHTFYIFIHLIGSHWTFTLRVCTREQHWESVCISAEWGEMLTVQVQPPPRVPML